MLDVKFHHIRGKNFVFVDGHNGIYYASPGRELTENDLFIETKTNKQAHQILRNLRRKNFTLASSLNHLGDLIIACAETHESDHFNKAIGRKIAKERLEWYFSGTGDALASFLYYIFNFNKNKHHIKRCFIEQYRQQQKEAQKLELISRQDLPKSDDYQSLSNWEEDQVD